MLWAFDRWEKAERCYLHLPHAWRIGLGWWGGAHGNMSPLRCMGMSDHVHEREGAREAAPRGRWERDLLCGAGGGWWAAL